MSSSSPIGEVSAGDVRIDVLLVEVDVVLVEVDVLLVEVDVLLLEDDDFDIGMEA
jgi:hypothetical protein